MKNTVWLTLGLMGCVFQAAAGKAPIEIHPTSDFFMRPQQVIPFDGVSFLGYVITNHTQFTQSLNINVPNGLSLTKRPHLLPLCVDKSGTGLASGESCIVILKAAASVIREKVPGGIIDGGFTVGIKPPNRGLSASLATFQPSPSNVPVVSVSQLNSNTTNLALSVNNVVPPFNALTGKPRKIVLTSGSGSSVSNVTFSISPDLPSDAVVTPSSQNCGTITSSTPCTITITPGSTATTTSSQLTVSIDGVSSLKIPVDILTYGSTYQGGYVFAIDDTTADTLSVGGKVAAQKNQAPLFPLGIIWSSNGTYGCSVGNYAPCTSYAFINGIDELSTHPPDACNGETDGACNTKVIVDYFNNNNETTPGTPVDPKQYAAGLCTQVIEKYNDWYLPAICEMGYFVAGPNTPDATNNCGTEDSPLMQNMISNLTQDQQMSLAGPFWSSTEYSTTDGTEDNAWDEYFESGVQTHDGKEDAVGVRCVRAMTQNSPSS